MARIRSIKPDFWTSEQILNLSLTARLFFIGLWNFASDYGCHPNQPKNLKVKIFPADDDVTVANIRGYIVELSSNGLIGFFEADGVEYISILGWSAHQRVDKPRKGDVKPPSNVKHRRETSSNDLGNVTEASQRKEGRKEGGREGSIDHDHHSATTSAAMSGSGGTLDATPSRTSTTNPTPPSQLGPEYVEVTVPTGAKLKISRWGSVDEVWAPRDCPQTCLTRAQALAMYRDAVEAMELEIPPALRRPQIVQAVA